MDAERLPPRARELRRSKTLMRRLIVGLRGRFDDELRGKQVTTSQIRLLKELKEKPNSSGAQIARACYVTPQSAQAMMARAVERGWVVRGKDPENDRLVTARLTPAGERMLAYADAILTKLEEELWAGVSLAELRAMNGVIERGLSNLGA